MMPNGSRWVAVVAATLSVVAMASEPVPSQSTPGGPLLFRVVLPRPDVCLGQRHLEAEVELRNTSTSFTPYFSMPPCLMSRISRRPTLCSSSPTVPATTLMPELLDGVAQFLLGQDHFLLGDLQGGLVDVEGHLALHLHEAAFGRVQDHGVDRPPGPAGPSSWPSPRA